MQPNGSSHSAASSLDADPNDKDESYLLCIFLVKSGSKDRDSLLFRYPYALEGEQLEINTKNVKRKHRNPFALVIKDNSNTRSVPNNSNAGSQPLIAGKQTTPLLTELDPSALQHNIVNNSSLYDRNLATVVNLPMTVVSNLFAVKPELCGLKFEIKINNVRFVGHPLLLTTDDDQKERRSKDLLGFNVVFALRANANHDVVSSYWECSRVVAKMLLHEEDRDSYLSRQAKIMLSCHEQIASPQSDKDSPYPLILEKSQLAEILKKIYEDLKLNGSVHTKINDYVDLNLFVPQTVHRLTLKYHRQVPIIGGSEIRKCIENLESYHTILLLVEPAKILSTLPKDEIMAYANFLCCATVYKNLAQISDESKTTWDDITKMITQLVFSAMAIIIHPICESNVYILNPLASTSIDSPLIEKFFEVFQGANLLTFMSEFSLGTSISQLRNPLQSQQQEIQLVDQVVWMLKHRLLVQIHTYIFLMPQINSIDIRLNGSSSDSKINLFKEKQTNHGNNMNGINVINNYNGMNGNNYGNKTLIENNRVKQITSPTVMKRNLINKEISNLESGKIDSFDDDMKQALADHGLTPIECNNILSISASKCKNDLKLFTKLLPYFNGKNHIEHILYSENGLIQRSQLLALIDKYRQVLVTCQYEDKAVAQLCPYYCR